MNAIDLALEKQRLQLKIAFQRDAISRYGAGLVPLFEAADHIVASTQWLKRHPEAVAGGVAVFVAMRPRRWQRLWRWTRRSLFVWRLWRENAHRLAPLLRRR